MKKSLVTAFIPCRKGSERIRSKNTLPFSGVEGGLTRIKLEQCLSCNEIDTVLVSTNDEVVMEICRPFQKIHGSRLSVISRPEELCRSDMSTDALITYVPTIISDPDRSILWTHVTSPFMDAEKYSEVIKQYWKVIESESHDSLMTVTELNKFIWDSSKPANYDGDKVKWPRTQDLDKLFEINSAAFIATRKVYQATGDRIGSKPYFYELGYIRGFDIDWQEDYKIAECLWRNKASLDLDC